MKIVQDKELYDKYKNCEKHMIIIPLMHSENVEDGELCLKLVDELVEANKDSEEMSGYFKSVQNYAKDHLEVIKKYGRYPTRNKALGRENTPEEEEYLKTANSWGQ